MKVKRFLLSITLIISLILSIPRTASAASAGNIIWNLLNYYGHYQDAAKTDITLLLEQLRRLDPEAAEDWQLVLEGWAWASRALEITPDELHDGLPRDASLCIVVMGFELNYDGTMKEELLGRLQAALASAEKYPNAYILCTGGGTAPGNWKATEAGKMAQWLAEQGVEPERIIVEDKSISSEQNAIYSLKILKETYPEVDSLALISSDYHLRRCYVLFHAALVLSGSEEAYTIVGNAGYDAGHEGNEGFLVEAEGVGLIANTEIRNTYPPVLAQLTQITLQADTQYTAGDALNLTVTAHYDKDITRDVTAEAVISGYDPTRAGTQALTVEYTENDRTASAALEITVAEAPTEATLPPATIASAPAQVTAPPATAPVRSAAEPTKPAQPSLVILLLPLALAAVLTLILVHLLRKERIRRRKKRRRKE